MGVVETIKDKCKRCYSCVRNCPAKAIKIREGQAYVIDERCIGCGNCVKICSQNAKKIESGIENTYKLLNSGQKVFAVLAPSFPASFNEFKPRQIVTALKKLGFEQVIEVAFGADMISKEYSKLFKQNNMWVIISSPCPAIVNFIEKYHPSLIPFLAPIVSPMMAIGRIIKYKYAPDANVVFIGPCIAKKKEKVDPKLQGIIDEVLTFQEIKEMFKEQNINPLELDETDFDGPHPNIGRIFPVSGGLLKTAAIESDILENDIIVTEGKDRTLEIINGTEEGKVEAKFLDILFCEGCINGPVMDNDLSVFIRKDIISNYVRSESEILDKDKYIADIEEYSSVDLRRAFTIENIELPKPTKEEIEEILKKVNKFKKEDELNCGSCGYNTCREKAVAVYQGLAEIEMCLPYLIDQLQKMNRELMQAQQRMIMAARLSSMGEIAAGVAHEINNPLSGVLTYLKLMEKKFSETSIESLNIPNLLKYVKTMESETARCSEIVKNLLEFARPTEAERELTSLEDIIRKTLLLVKHQIQLQGIEIIEEYQPYLPKITADAKQIQQVFLNLFINSAQAMSNGGKLFIKVKTDNNKHIITEVTDTGCGIPKENINKVFDPFFTTKLDKKGTGLGLSVVYSIIQRHNGNIEVTSKVGEGTTFTIKFPINDTKEN